MYFNLFYVLVYNVVIEKKKQQQQLNLKIEYPPPYEHLVWDLKRADVSMRLVSVNIS